MVSVRAVMRWLCQAVGMSQPTQVEVAHDGLRRRLTIEELAERLRTTPTAIYCLRYRGEGPPAVRVGRRLLFDPVEVEEWLAAKAS